jgi:hypothetical protein
MAARREVPVYGPVEFVRTDRKHSLNYKPVLFPVNAMLGKMNIVEHSSVAFLNQTNAHAEHVAVHSQELMRYLAETDAHGYKWPSRIVLYILSRPVAVDLSTIPKDTGKYVPYHATCPQPVENMLRRLVNVDEIDRAAPAMGINPRETVIDPWQSNGERDRFVALTSRRCVENFT